MPYYFSVTNIDELINIRDIEIFPNPANSYITIKAIEFINKLQIINIIGEVIYETRTIDKQVTISTEKFSPGCYVVNAYSNSGISQKKFIVSR